MPTHFDLNQEPGPSSYWSLLAETRKFLEDARDAMIRGDENLAMHILDRAHERFKCSN